VLTIFKILPFPEKFIRFHPPKFSDDLLLLLVIDHEFRISPLFQYISPLFRENYYFLPTLKNFPPVLGKSPAFYILYVYFVPPHTLTMMHLLHVLDTPARYKEY